MTYCTTADAIAAGADPNDPALVTAMGAADERVERFTGEVFTPDAAPRTVVLRVLESGFVSAPYVRTVTSITFEGATATLPSTAYVVSNGTIRIIAGYAQYADAFIAGAEPWSGGWANILGTITPERVRVVGTFGLDATPYEVKRAAALITAAIVPTSYVPQADAEGNPAGVAPVSDAGSQQSPTPESVASNGGYAHRLERTTGVAEADRLLRPFMRGGGWKVG
jgi:hypothetical protein